MRLRNIKNAQDIISKSKYLVLKPKEYKGKMNELFKNKNKIEIEIGMGKGDFIINKAKNNPNINFIGIEKYASVLVKTVKKLNDCNLNNIKIMNIDANEIDEVFDKEVNKIYLNFSDPWPKKKHANRRLTSPIFLEKYAKIFEKDYCIEMKTDNKNLFEYSLIALSQNGYLFEELKLDLYSDLSEDNIQTEYEKKFVNLGLTIYKFKAQCKLNTKKKK